ncbi:MAG: hypothetical protein IJX63_05890 [Lachnospiraceae bacterium]|nr:hypothetical protein [Lachnospiraceae bacterium]
MENMDAACLEMIKENLMDDYFTPKIKTEVIFDMLLTPVISEIMEPVIEDKTELVAKEFPLRKSKLEGEPSKLAEGDFRNCNVDYLLRSTERETWYLVELKTTSSSEGGKQRKRYQALVKNATADIYNDFVELLAHIYKVDYAPKDSLKTVFERCVNDVIVNESYKDVAAKRKEVGSRKYLYTAAQLLDKKVGLEPRTKLAPLKLVYITPDGKGVDGIPYISLKDIVEDENAKKISERIGENEKKRAYWEWLREVLKHIIIDNM